jgi:hypothetical protein
MQAGRLHLRKELPLIGWFERADEVLDHGLAGIGGPGDRDDVEPVAAFEQIVPLEIPQRQSRQTLLLLLIDRFQRVPGNVAFASFDLDKDDDSIAIDGHDVEFASLIAGGAGDDDVAFALEKLCRRSLAALA